MPLSSAQRALFSKSVSSAATPGTSKLCHRISTRHFLSSERTSASPRTGRSSRAQVAAGRPSPCPAARLVVLGTTQSQTPLVLPMGTRRRRHIKTRRPPRRTTLRRHMVMLLPGARRIISSSSSMVGSRSNTMVRLHLLQRNPNALGHMLPHTTNQCSLRHSPSSTALLLRPLLAHFRVRLRPPRPATALPSPHTRLNNPPHHSRVVMQARQPRLHITPARPRLRCRPHRHRQRLPTRQHLRILPNSISKRNSTSSRPSRRSSISSRHSSPRSNSKPHSIRPRSSRQQRQRRRRHRSSHGH
mmetsp:Transcript_41681/g.87040  ORF Transcript_41681/g.87040 Transcript_41681/m.87040 type:complete len:301 (-) Transcript_41681:576-1478(-)